MSEASVAVGRRVAELLLAEFESAYRSGDFGVIAQDVAVFDKQHFLALLPDIFEQAKGRLRISLVGELDDVATFQSIYPQFAEFVSSEEEMAVRWRNKVEDHCRCRKRSFEQAGFAEGVPVPRRAQSHHQALRRTARQG